MLNRFTDVIRYVADPLFSKEHLITNTSIFEQCSAVKKTDRIDVECKMAHGQF